MTSLEINHLTALACEALKPLDMQCKYEHDKASGHFLWNFYRRGRKLSGTGNPKCVMTRISRYKATPKRKAS